MISEKFSIIPEHHSHDIPYINLQKRLNKFPQSAPASNALYKILKLIFSRKEAALVSVLPIKPFTTEIAANIWKCSVPQSIEILNTLADKGVILDIENGKERKFMLVPPMAGFFEFTIMRTDGKFDRKILSELYYEYINVEDKFITNIFKLNPPIDRVFIYEDQIPEQIYFEILDYERVSNTIETSSCITVGQCYCRHKMEMNGTQSFGKALGVKNIPVVKGQSLPAYDPRVIRGIGVTYATSTMGADHTAGYTIAPEILKSGGGADPRDIKKADLSRAFQSTTAYIDQAGYCIFIAFAILDISSGMEGLHETLEGFLGVDKFDITKEGNKIMKIERKFNLDAGFTKTDDRLPAFFLKEPLPPHNLVFEVPDAELDAVWEKL